MGMTINDPVVGCSTAWCSCVLATAGQTIYSIPCEHLPEGTCFGKGQILTYAVFAGWLKRITTVKSSLLLQTSNAGASIRWWVEIPKAHAWFTISWGWIIDQSYIHQLQNGFIERIPINFSTPPYDLWMLRTLRTQGPDIYSCFCYGLYTLLLWFTTYSTHFFLL